jgi:hypothetical protein
MEGREERQIGTRPIMPAQAYRDVIDPFFGGLNGCIEVRNLRHDRSNLAYHF